MNHKSTAVIQPGLVCKSFDGGYVGMKCSVERKIGVPRYQWTDWDTKSESCVVKFADLQDCQEFLWTISIRDEDGVWHKFSQPQELVIECGYGLEVGCLESSMRFAAQELSKSRRIRPGYYSVEEAS